MTADLVPASLAVAVGACGVALSLGAALVWRRGERARAQANAAERHADRHLRAVADALDLAEPQRRPASGRRAKAGLDWRSAVHERIQRLRTECDAALAASDPSTPRNEGTPVTLAHVRDILSVLSDALAQGSLAPRALDLASRLGIESDLSATGRALDTLVEAGNSEAIVDGLEAGALDHVLTTAELLAAYFPADGDLSQLTEGYGAAAALLRLDLAMRGRVVRLPRSLTTVSGHDVVIERFDRRELRRIPEIADIANRVGDRAGYTAMVVDCIAPGWTGPGGSRPATIVAWDRASWRPV